MGRAQSDTYSSSFTKSDNVNLDETFDRKSALVHVLAIPMSPDGVYWIYSRQNHETRFFLKLILSLH